jgi:hypothetical protein
MRAPDDRPSDRPLDRSTASLSDPLPHTPAAAAMRDALPDSAVRPDAVHPSAADAPTHRDHADAPGAAAAGDRRSDGNPGDEIGEAVGGISGVLTGAAIGSLGGPIGTVIGGIAGAVSGWWAGRAISESAYHATHDDDEFYRGRHADAPAARSYDDVRPAYHLGHLAGRNPDYAGRDFDDVEADLRHGWTGDVSARHGGWDEVRGYARHAFERSRATATHAPHVGGPSAGAEGPATGVAATGGAAGTATGGTATEGSRAAPATGSLDVGAASRGSGI